MKDKSVNAKVNRYALIARIAQSAALRSEAEEKSRRQAERSVTNPHASDYIAGLRLEPETDSI
jgi:hypothetical protein